MGTKNKKILYILHAYQNRGGTEEHTKQLAESISDQFDTAILARSGDEILLIINNSIQTRYPAPKLNWPVVPLYDNNCENVLSEVVHKFSPDIIHIQHFSNWHLSIIDQITSFKIPTLLSLHDYYLLTPFFTNQYRASEAINSQELSRKLYGGDITHYLKKRSEYLKHSIDKIQKIIVPSVYLKKVIEDKFKCTCTVIEHGIKKLEPIKERDLSSLEFGYIGSLIPQKGWNVLRDAFRAVKDKMPYTKLHMFGDGDGVSEDEKKNEPQIIFHGRYEYADLPHILNKFDIGIIPSIFEETFCLTLSELWEGKKPVIVSNIGALGERVTHETNGLKVPPGDVNRLSEALLWFQVNDTWRKWTLPVPRKTQDMSLDYRSIYENILHL